MTFVFPRATRDRVARDVPYNILVIRNCTLSKPQRRRHLVCIEFKVEMMEDEEEREDDDLDTYEGREKKIKVGEFEKKEKKTM